MTAYAHRRLSLVWMTVKLGCVGCAAFSILPSCGGQTELPTADGVAPGYCAKACSDTADCCPDGDMACPGEYPRNFVCEGGVCRAPQCEQDEHCSYLEDIAGSGTYVCRIRDGHRGCMESCTNDEDCAASGGLAGGTCSGQADDGTRICVASLGTASLGCKSDADCPTGKHCQSGTCGCANDAECKPNLDVCTKDRDFAYPPSAAPGSTKP